jgi:UDPglucose 6-dehydrogenase
MRVLKRRVTVLGLGKLGACLAACLAHKGFSVVGVDTDLRVVDSLNQGKAPVVEPGLDQLIQECRGELAATQDAAEAVRQTAFTFIVLPTPSDSNGFFSTQYVRESARAIGRALAAQENYHVVVLVSTVLPGDTEDALVKVLEQESGKKCSVDFGVCYNPEFIALGSVIHDMLQPDLIVIGESDSRAGDLLEELYKDFVDNDPAIIRSSFANIELSKISINSYLTMKITFANMLAELCEKIPDGDVDLVTRALGSDSRIGARYLKGGLGFGGPCFPRDTVAFTAMARKLGVAVELGSAVASYNRSIPTRVVRVAQRYLRPTGKAAVFGLAYKLNTPVVEESQGLEIAQRLRNGGATVVVHDPFAMDGARRILGASVQYANTIKEGVEGADVLILSNPLPELKVLVREPFRKSREPVVVIDCWRFLPELAEKPNIRYIGLGLRRAGSVENT